MGHFSDGSGVTVDRRRAMRIAERMADGHKEPFGQGVIPPGLITQDHAGIGQLLATGITFDRAAFAYDVNGYTGYTCNGAGQVSSPKWTKVGARANNLRVALGPIDEPTYFWIWATFGWANNGTSDAGRAVAVLYDNFDLGVTGVVRASNPMSDWRPGDNNFRNQAYIGFLGVDLSDVNTFQLASGQGDWNIGMQQQMSGPQNVGNTSANRQSIIVFASSVPVEGALNVTLDGELD